MVFEVIENPGREWDLFANQYTGIAFFRSDWGRVLEQGLGAKLHYCCIREQGKIVGGAPGIILGFANMKLYYSSINYGGYIGEKRYSDLFYQYLINHLRSKKFKVDLAYIYPSPFDVVPPCEISLKTEKTAITYLDVENKTLQAIEKSFDRGVRQSLRKAEKLGLKFRFCRDREDVATAYALYEQSMKRNRALVRYQPKWFNAVYDNLIMKGAADLCAVFHDNTPIASVILLYSAEGIHLLNNGSSTGHLHLRASDFMQYEIIRTCLEKKKKYVDFMNSMPSDKGLITWKEKFGSKTKLADNYVLINSRLKYLCWNLAKKVSPILAR